MKDMYTFDKDKDAAMRTYDEVNEVYAELFNGLGVPFAKGAYTVGTIRKNEILIFRYFRSGSRCQRYGWIRFA